MKPLAIIWDFDGTIVDSNRKNYTITKDLLRNELKIDVDQISALSNYSAYLRALELHTNWRSLYSLGFGIDKEVLDRAGDQWAHYQLNTNVDAPVFSGLKAVLELYSDVPQGIVSQNSTENIIRNLETEKCADLFSKIIGYQDVPYIAQKPDPTGLLMCIEDLLGSGNHSFGTVIYIGDHVTDVATAENAQGRLSSMGKSFNVKPIRVCFEKDTDDELVNCDKPSDLPNIITKIVTNSDSLQI
jgi:HAD superfamily hydrolase (TIGR01549 family)